MGLVQRVAQPGVTNSGRPNAQTGRPCLPPIATKNRLCLVIVRQAVALIAENPSLAIDEAGPDRAKIRDALEKQTGFKGIGGVFNRSAEDHNGLNKDAFVLVEIQNGDWKLISD